MHNIDVLSISKMRIHSNKCRDRMLARDLDSIDKNLAIMANIEITPEPT
jgi:hypothetical protein